MLEEPRADAIYRALELVWARMYEEKDDTDSVWEGYTTHLMADLKIPIPYYGKILDALQRMGCATQLQRGGGTSPSRWVVHKAPTLDGYIEVKPQLGGMRGGKSATTDEILEQRVSDIEKRVGTIDILKALTDLQSSLNAVKSRMDSLEGEKDDVVA